MKLTKEQIAEIDEEWQEVKKMRPPEFTLMEYEHKASALSLHIPALLAHIAEQEREIQALDKSEDQLCRERDDAEQALSQAYYLVTGRSPEWSNLFGHNEAHEEIEATMNLLKSEIKEARLTCAAAQRVIDAAWLVHSFVKRNTYPQEGSEKFFEMTRIIDGLENPLYAHKQSLTPSVNQQPERKE